MEDFYDDDFDGSLSMDELMKDDELLMDAIFSDIELNECTDVIDLVDLRPKKGDTIEVEYLTSTHKVEQVWQNEEMLNIFYNGMPKTIKFSDITVINKKTVI